MQAPVGDEIRAVLATEPRRAVTVPDYHRMLEVGILDEDDRVELLEGVIIAVSPRAKPTRKRSFG